jgi:hypothetical protein
MVKSQKKTIHRRDYTSQRGSSRTLSQRQKRCRTRYVLYILWTVQNFMSNMSLVIFFLVASQALFTDFVPCAAPLSSQSRDPRLCTMHSKRCSMSFGVSCAASATVCCVFLRNSEYVYCEYILANNLGAADPMISSRRSTQVWWTKQDLKKRKTKPMILPHMQEVMLIVWHNLHLRQTRNHHH